MQTNLMDETLEHHGIKGMKWGVRRTPEQLGHQSSKRQVKKLSSKLELLMAEDFKVM